MKITFYGDYSSPMNYAENLYINGELLQGELVIPEGTETIRDCAFLGCIALTSVTIPDGVTRIGRSTFYFCGKLSTIDYQGTMAQWRAIKKHDDWDVYTGDYTVYCTDGKIDKYDY